MLKSAESECYDALRLDPGNHEARSMLARVLATEKMASDAVAKLPDLDELTLAYAAGLGNAEGTVAALGWATLTDALAASLDQNDKTASTTVEVSIAATISERRSLQSRRAKPA